MAESVASIQPDIIRNDVALYCPSCMYDLRGTTGDTCPECGAAVDRKLLEKSSIHWVHREGLGVGAFLKTAMRATFKTEFFCLEIARPIALEDARKFRRRVVWLLVTLMSLFALAVTLLATESGDPVDQLWQHSPLLSVLLGMCYVGLLWLFFMGWSGLHMYWFHPKGLSVEQQNRAIALSHYACAPLLGFFISYTAIGLSMIASVIGTDAGSDAWAWVSVAFGIPGGITVILTVAAFLFVCARMAQHTSNRTGLTRALLWVTLPVTWLIWAIAMFLVLPLIGLYLYVVFSTI